MTEGNSEAMPSHADEWAHGYKTAWAELGERLEAEQAAHAASPPDAGGEG